MSSPEVRSTVCRVVFPHYLFDEPFVGSSSALTEELLDVLGLELTKPEPSPPPPPTPTPPPPSDTTEPTFSLAAVVSCPVSYFYVETLLCLSIYV